MIQNVNNEEYSSTRQITYQGTGLSDIADKYYLSCH